MDAPELIGRQAELEAVLTLLDSRERLPAAAVLHGPAGIGKTSLWLVGVEAARERGYRVLSSRPSEAEARLSYAGLTDLLGAAAVDVLPTLPVVQRRALEAALLLGDGEETADERAVGAAFLAALRLLGGEEPLCLAVDDVQWLDAASLAAVRFAQHRLEHEPVVTLVAARGDVPSWLRRTAAGPTLVAVEMGGLSLGATRELLRARLDATFPRPTLIRLWEASAGNPFLALELAGALRRRSRVTLVPGEELPIPSAVGELLAERLDGLSEAGLEVARVVAALADPTVPLVESAAGRSADAGLREALGTRILEADGAALRFSHPLLASAVSGRETPAERRSLHARLATVAPTSEERARHLALARVRPSRTVAAVLDEAARSAQRRGAPVAAAELAEHALRLTPTTSPADVFRRALVAAERQHAAGDDERAVALLEQATVDAAPGSGRAAALAQLATVQPTPREAVLVYEQALEEATGDAALEATIHLRLAEVMRFRDGVERGLEHAELAVDAAARTDDVGLHCRAVAVRHMLQANSARPLAHDAVDTALALERALPDWPLVDGPAWAVSHQLVWFVELDPARRLLLELLESYRSRGDTDGEATTLWYLSLLEWRAGNWAEADVYAAGSLELVAQLGRIHPPEHFPAAIVAAHRGRVDEAWRRASAALEQSEIEGMRVGQTGFGWVLGFLELSVGDNAAALTRLRRVNEIRESFTGEPAMRLELGDLLEALIATGELDEAEELLTTWEPRAEALDRAWSLAILARGRGLLAAARGDFGGAFEAFERALAEHDRVADPFARARTLLALGRTERRAKRRGAARATLEDARVRFEALGAPLWAEQARAELARIGGRAPSRGELTEAERRIAALVADGRTNREVAAALFLTEHSVETTLTRVYRKLGVRSRAELTRRLSNS